MFVASPEDEAPFAQKADELLTKMIEAMGLRREDVCIVSLPANDTELLQKEIEAVNPEVVVGLGASMSHAMLRTEEPLNQLRGTFHTCPWIKRQDGSEISVMPTFPPSFLLRNPNMKKPAWEDLQQVMTKLGLKK